MAHYHSSFKVAFGSVWSILGVATTALSVFNLLLRFWSIPIAKIILMIIAAYRNTFHSAINFVLKFFPHIKLNIWHKDAIVIWLALGAVTYRTIIHIFKDREPNLKSDNFIVTHQSIIINWLLEKRWRHYILLILCITIWPLLIVMLFFEPYAQASHGGQSVIFFDCPSQGSNHRL
jgi:hypothetical protein